MYRSLAQVCLIIASETLMKTNIKIVHSHNYAWWLWSETLIKLWSQFYLVEFFLDAVLLFLNQTVTLAGLSSSCSAIFSISSLSGCCVISNLLWRYCSWPLVNVVLERLFSKSPSISLTCAKRECLRLLFLNQLRMEDGGMFISLPRASHFSLLGDLFLAYTTSSDIASSSVNEYFTFAAQSGAACLL